MSDEGELSPRSDELRALYRRLQPPPLADDLAGADPETVRVVRWMQGAFRALGPERAVVPPSLARMRPPAHVGPRVRVIAAAAAVLLLAGAALWRALSRTGPTSAPARVAQVPSSESARAVEVLDVRPDRLELRSGPVRLMLLDPPPHEPIEDPPGS